jgi:hypothetical protein
MGHPVMTRGQSKLKYHCIEVIAGSRACEATRLLQDVRVLSAEAPRLPLATCDRPANCVCTYRHFDDRRQGPRRDNEHATVPRQYTGGPERRRWRGRRDSDYE